MRQARCLGNRVLFQVAIAIGIAIASFGWILGEPDTVRPLMGVGNLPILVGVAMLLLAKFAPRE